jgi:hypothetical protein
MSARVKKFHPALKYAGYSATGLLPGEDPAAFEELHQDLIAELQPDGPLVHSCLGYLAGVCPSLLAGAGSSAGRFHGAEGANSR